MRKQFRVQKKPKIVFDKPQNTINRDSFIERVIDWQEEGNHVQYLLHEYDDNYRKKICSNCSLEQQQKRNCIKIDMYTSDGIQITSCGHMDKARNRKHSKLIRRFVCSNPVLNFT